MDVDDVRRLALALPDVTERSSWGEPAWFHRRLVARMWDAHRLTVHVEDDGERRALAAQEPDVYSTTDHHRGTDLVLVDLRAADADLVRAHLAESWWWAAPDVLRRRHAHLGPGTSAGGPG
ncbi:MmcQ/YjbR family DNA-binding protein [Cellulomonas wangsupingiae]|uniref:MmcQ/YjbR family DNA-binding protein n=1 Tax=Cellulomonas wangsupingiae TaxID=2968085 RepID=A0ABY5K4N0_9CELL|nr:MmcQ/YjbR family DNA-binding protein [Cellulomonas wangsupingiae]MCC2335465.1 MmcQ/YjbR family DNA-binding protein [Cellulomonas wangsupingiae]UUI64361.1 MmcQ/YjbR family DNA-binding protein [Cellulomonas wangsupingiae]